MERPYFVNFYEVWEFYWPADVTYGELRRAANDPR